MEDDNGKKTATAGTVGGVAGGAADMRQAERSTVIGAFDNETEAQRAVEQLVAQGFDRADVHIERGQAGMDTQPAAGAQEHKRGGFFSWLFGDDDASEPHRATYDEAVRRGSTVVVVDVADDRQAERAVSCLHGLGAIDVDERAQAWRAEGWSDRQPAAGQEGVLDVVQEELQVGRRALDKGGVRVVQRVTETPVREVVRLREERAVVDRRAVDRPATAGDLDTFREGTLEVRETAEEPVVAKTARVVEEVRVGKDVREREQAVEESVRRKDVDVQRIEGSRTLESERAVASEGERDRIERERGGDLTGKPRRKL